MLTIKFNPNTNHMGFSLIEIVVAVAILTILSVAFVPSLLIYTREAKAAKDNAKFESIETALKSAANEREVVVNLQQNPNVGKLSTTDDAKEKRIAISFYIDEKGVVAFNSEESWIQYEFKPEESEGLISSKSKLWLNSYQSVGDLYETKNTDNWDKWLTYIITPKTDGSVAACEHIITKDKPTWEEIKGELV